MRENGVCIHTKMVPCNDAAPENATSTVVSIEIEYTEFGFGHSVAMGTGYLVASAPEANETVVLRLNAEQTDFIEPMKSLLAPENPLDYRFGVDVSTDEGHIGVLSMSLTDGLAPVVSFYSLSIDGTLIQNLQPYYASFDASAASFAMNGEYAVVGTANGSDDTGLATVLHLGADGEWDEYYDVTNQPAVLNSGDSADGDLFGNAVSIQNGVIVLSAPGLDSVRGLNTGRLYVFDLPSDPATSCCDLNTGLIYSEGMSCGSADTTCDPMDTCDAAGSCVFNLANAGVLCGDTTSNDCNSADTCDGMGQCLENLVAQGVFCGDSTDNDCNGADTCDGMGQCRDNLVTEDTPCGDFQNTECADLSTCDGSGICIVNWQPDGPIDASGIGGACLEAVICQAGDIVVVPVSADSSTVCRKASSDCDVAETCDGVNID